MATTPTLELRDGSGYTNSLTFTTNQDAITLRGKLSADTVALQVSINGGTYVTDNNLFLVTLDSFVFPNPNVYPSGYSLQQGANSFSFRAIDIVGGVSAPSTATVTLMTDSVLVNAGTVIPTGVRVERKRSTVDVFASLPAGGTGTLNFIGFNFYASTAPSGATGYFKINDSLVSPSSSVYTENLYNRTAATALWDDPQRQLLRVRVTEENEFGTELVVRYNETTDLSLFFNKARFQYNLDNYSYINYAVFNHNRGGGPNTINSDQFAAVVNSAPLYYVVTAVFYDTVGNTEYESAYSQEVLGQPLVIDTNVIDLPARAQTSIVTDYINAVTLVNAEISLVPGSTTRDVSIDPFASEAERLWFLMDFVHRSQSFVTLLQIDDITGSGVSDPVATSAYKSALKAALGYTTDSSVQSLIDLQFEKLAKNVNCDRLGGASATGQVVFYTATKPTVDLTVPAGTVVSTVGSSTVATVGFTVGGTYILPAAQADAYYNYTTKQYELTATIVAQSTGTASNVPAGVITVVSGVTGLAVTNNAATIGGTDVESNAQLASRAILSFASVDAGTEYGYYSTAAAQQGVTKTKIVKSGDSLMMRDWDDVRNKHIGGKVDVWVQGLNESQVTEKFAFSYEIARDVQCEIVDLATFKFRVLDSRVTVGTPLLEILSDPAQGLGVKNATTGQVYDLTDVKVLDYQTFQLSSLVAQPATAIDDIIYADFRFRSNNQFIFSLQPVRRIVSVVGEVSGTLTPTTNYNLYKLEDPLLYGESTAASDYVSVTQSAGKPVGNQILVNDEVHTLIGFVEEPLDSIGINTATIRVFSSDRLTEYVNPNDFEIISGTDRTPPKIVRSSTSTIVSGQQVSVDYTKDENFVVVYVINDILQQLQQTINNRRHVTADVLVKQAVLNAINIETTVQLLAGYSKDTVDPNIRTNVSLELNKRTIGQGVAQSDVIHAVDATTGVDYEIVPLARMAYADGSRIMRELVPSAYVRLPNLDAGGQLVYLLTDALNYPTTDGGGLTTEHHGVFQDDVAMTMATDPLQVGKLINGAYIIGNGGQILPGYTDDATLIAQGYLTPSARAAAVIALTANRVLLALSDSVVPPDSPEHHVYTVSYVVRGDSGSHDVAGAAVEYLDLGAFTITYRSA